MRFTSQPLKCGLTLLLIGSLTFLPGCWSRKELNKIGIVSAMGVDLNESNEIEITVQVTTLSGANSKEDISNQVRIVSSTGETMFDAVRNLMTKSGDRLFYPHNSVIVFGEDAARAGLGPMLDFLERDPEIRMATWLLVTPGKAKDIIEARSDEEKVSGRHINLLLEDNRSTSKGVAFDLLDYLGISLADGFEPVLGKIQKIENEAEHGFLVEGAGAFKGDKLVGWLDAEDARGYLWMRNLVKGGIIPAYEGEGDQDTGVKGSELNRRISFEIIRSKTKTKSILDDDQNLRFEIEVNVTCNLGERMLDEEASTNEEIGKLRSVLNHAVLREMQGIVEKAQKELKLDIFGFGAATFREHPEYWNEIKDDWEEIFPKVEIEIQVQSEVKLIGLTR